MVWVTRETSSAKALDLPVGRTCSRAGESCRSDRTRKPGDGEGKAARPEALPTYPGWSGDRGAALLIDSTLSDALDRSTSKSRDADALIAQLVRAPA